MASETTRRSQATPMKDAIEAFLKTFDLKARFNETYLIAFWGRMMCQQLPLEPKKSTLKIGFYISESTPRHFVKSFSWQKLSFSTSSIKTLVSLWLMMLCFFENFFIVKLCFCLKLS